MLLRFGAEGCGFEFLRIGLLKPETLSAKPAAWEVSRSVFFEHSWFSPVGNELDSS